MRTRAIVTSLLAYLVLVTALMPFHPPDLRRSAPRGLWPDDPVILVPVVVGWVVVVALLVRVLRAVTAVTLYADGSLLLSAPLRSVHTESGRLRRLQRVRLVANELVTDDVTVRLAGGMLCGELIEALRAARPGLDVADDIQWRHPSRPDPTPEPKQPGPAGATTWAAPVRETLGRQQSIETWSSWSVPVPRGTARRGGARSGHWHTPLWWVPVGVVLLSLGTAWAVAMPLGVILAIDLGGVILPFVLLTLGAVWAFYPAVVVAWMFTTTSLDLDPDATLTIRAPARTLCLRVADAWTVRLVVGFTRTGRERPPTFVLDTATGPVRLPHRLVDPDLLEALANANPLMRVPQRATGR